MKARTSKRIFCAVLALLLLSTAFTGAWAESFSAVSKIGGIRIFRDSAATDYWGTMPRYTVVTVESYADGIALINYHGYRGYALVEDMDAVASVAKRAVVSTNSRVFRYASTSSASVAVPQGMEVYVLAIQGKCAAVERNGYVGFMYTGHLQIEETTDTSTDEQTQTEDGTAATETEQRKNPAASETVEAIFESGQYTNEQLIYEFATRVLGYNCAAACGLLANIKYESGYRAVATGDNDTSLGICQWHAGRKTRLLNWCSSNGYDGTTLLGQLYYLKYELEKYYPKVHSYLLSVSNDTKGAYDAAYYFCYNFEAPSNRASKSDTRGNYAITTLFPKYGSGIAVES